MAGLLDDFPEALSVVIDAHIGAKLLQRRMSLFSLIRLVQNQSLYSSSLPLALWRQVPWSRSNTSLHLLCTPKPNKFAQIPSPRTIFVLLTAVEFIASMASWKAPIMTTPLPMS